MGHRASVAYRHKDGVTVHHSQWGAYNAELLDDISEATPFGSKNLEPEYLNALVSSLEKMVDGTDMEFGGEVTKPQEPTPVEPEPYAVIEEAELGKAFLKWASNHVDPIQHETVYFIDTTVSPWDVEAHAPVYWRNSPSYQEARENRDFDVNPPFALINVGEDSHDVWGSREAESWEEFVKSLKAEFDNEKIHLV